MADEDTTANQLSERLADKQITGVSADGSDNPDRPITPTGITGVPQKDIVVVESDENILVEPPQEFYDGQNGDFETV